ncbi:MAG: hypothetical protein A2827_03860 [Candidatus Spechtbacteria bacterium RIFCSPHIGHO2_01_FULL_43_30]|uniref:HTH cro/C1-type domain-containing protein n=1 Tax=Candidatus Spechtbacteria bacterium RIFCSPHIGHO2_01_FULL_43_30 TaxID=1802158 RepID=A0A1G2H7V7_9BACT|nr:MAG: hypothetical protein A2827_03860 [Candidatus Spechtbacteria bacterium RIFCSPHIGHO2_01_FULL_43_30]
MKYLGQYLKGVRSDLGLSMYEVAKRTTLTPSYISKIENGNAFHTISAHILIEFSKCYNLPIVTILERSGFVPPTEDEFPGLSSYLRLKYNAPPHAVSDMELAWEIVKKRHNLTS